MTDPRPRPLGNETRHYWLALRMARATGADLQRALETGVISHADWADVVRRCRGCSWSAGCNCWMAVQEAGTASVPAACPNAGVFQRALADAGSG
jgi:hypothetical protein